MGKLRAGVIGTGSLGKHHVRILKSLDSVDLTCICDVDKKAAKTLSKEYRVPFFTKFEEMEHKVDLVSIATPTSYHYPVAKFFLLRGIHTLIEKPITFRLEEADELIKIAKDNNLALQVGHIERHNAAFKRVEKIADKVKFIEVHRLGPFTPRVKDCGVILDLMIHDLDIVLSLVNHEIEYLDAVGINVLTPHEDIANVRIKFKNGTIANITASRLTPERQRKIRLFQNDAYVSLDYQEQTIKIYRKGLLGINKEFLEIEKEEPLRNELKSFIASVKSGSGFGRPDIEARNALEVALRCLEIIKENNKVFSANR